MCACVCVCVCVCVCDDGGTGPGVCVWRVGRLKNGYGPISYKLELESLGRRLKHQVSEHNYILTRLEGQPNQPEHAASRLNTVLYHLTHSVSAHC